jgi:predicted nucleic acid-binding protein
MNGLQPLDDYFVNGKQQLGLRSKYLAEIQELHECLTEKKEPIWYSSESADLLYYASCIDALELLSGTATSQHATYQDALALLASPAYQVDADEAEAAALAKYRLRASLPYRKDKETPDEQRTRNEQENAAILEAINTLIDPSLWPGWPLPEVATIYNVPVATLYYACDKKLIPSRKAGDRLLLIDLRSPRWRSWHRKWRYSQK